MKRPQKKKAAKKSMFFRLFGEGNKKVAKKDRENGKPKKSKQSLPKPKPSTPLQRSIAEIKQMTQIGQKDPERLARLLASILAKERQKHQAAQERLDQQVWEIIHRAEKKGWEPRPGEDNGQGSPTG